MSALWCSIGNLDVKPLIHGGGQERDVRSGTLDAAGIAGFAAALAAPAVDTRPLRDELITGIRQAVPDAILNGDPVRRLANNAHFSFPGCPGDALLMLLTPPMWLSRRVRPAPPASRSPVTF